jgi:hypothetical protein
MVASAPFAVFVDTSEGGQGTLAAFVNRFVQPIAVLDRDQHGERTMVALDDEAFSRRGSVQDLPQ